MAETAARQPLGPQLAAGLALGGIGAAAALAPDWRMPAALAGLGAFGFLAVWTLARPYRWLALFAALTLLTPPLPLEMGSTGPHLALLAAALGLARLAAANPKLRLPVSGAGGPLLLYLAVLALSAGPALWISGPGAAAGSLVRTALFAIGVAAYLALRHGAAEPEAARWTRGLLVLGLLTALLGCVDFLLQLEPPAGYGEQMVWLSDATVRRAQGVFYDAAQFGAVCAFFLIGVAAAAVRRAASSKLLAAAAVTLLAALVFSFSRGAMLSALAGLLALAAVERRRWMGDTRLAAGAALAVAASAAAAALAAPELTRSYALRFVYTAWRAVADPAEALGVRLESWSRLLAMLAEHPERLLLGAGYKTLATGEAAGAPLIVDNQWLSALGETGLLGAAALALLLAAILRTSWRTSSSLAGLWSLCFWTGQLVQMLFVDLMTYWRVLPVYFMVLALAERSSERRAA